MSKSSTNTSIKFNIHVCEDQEIGVGGGGEVGVEKYNPHKNRLPR